MLCFLVQLAALQNGEGIREEIKKTRDALSQDKDQEQDWEEELEKLEDRIEKRLKELEKKIEAISRTAAKNAFNPSVTVYGNFATLHSEDPVYVDNTDPTTERIDDKAFFRTTEIDFRAAIDPYAEGVIILAIEGEADGGFEAEIEEGYILFKRLPIAETGGVKLKLGKFRPPFGVSNRLHLHDLPHTTRPMVVTRYLGGEQNEFFEAGLSTMGVEANFFLPDFWEPLTIEAFVDVLQSGETALTEGNDPSNPAYLVHLDFFFTLSDTSTLNIGTSRYHENGALSTRMTGVDVTFSWKPDQFSSVILGGEWISADREFDPGGGPIETDPTGWYFYAQVQLSSSVYLGARIEELEDPDDDALKIEGRSLYVSYYTSEFLRLRLGIESRESSDIPAEDDVDMVFLEFNFVFGSHPTHPYWVNK